MTLATGCADSKKLNVGGKEVNVRPYGWANADAKKVEGVVYQVNPGNVILSIIFVETVVVPVYLTGWELFEPVRVSASDDLVQAADSTKKK